MGALGRIEAPDTGSLRAEQLLLHIGQCQRHVCERIGLIEQPVPRVLAIRDVRSIHLERDLEDLRIERICRCKRHKRTVEVVEFLSDDDRCFPAERRLERLPSFRIRGDGYLLGRGVSRHTRYLGVKGETGETRLSEGILDRHLRKSII
eukprot:7376887-Prymnesium_polylepis.1